MSIHTEKAFEDVIEHHLLGDGGHLKGHSSHYDGHRGLLSTDLLAFVQATRPRWWSKWKAHFGDKLDDLFLAAVTQSLDQHGTLHVLRRGVEFYDRTVPLSYSRPAHGHNPKTLERYAANRVTLVRQLYFDPAPGSKKSVDLGIFVNGLPVATLELKNPLTGQTVDHAMKQYQRRDPKVALFRWKTRALVHFAVDPHKVRMTTRLTGEGTAFLPFDRGTGHGAGNEAEPGKHATAYLWEQVLARDSLLDILHRFMHLEVTEEKDPDTGTSSKNERVIFPRYHQLDCVRALVGAALADGVGKSYLVHHSAGSGKSNSIAWLAHRLSSLYAADGQKVFDSVVVLTDRLVLDRQLQETIYQFEQTDGKVTKVDKDSKQLAAALEGGAPIVISTIHKFGFLHDKIGALPARRYAIIVDEAHSSQSGDMARDVRAMLADGDVDAQVQAEIDDAIESGEMMTEPQQFAMRAAILRGRLANLSYFAFTATPKDKTLALFGHQDDAGQWAPFHLYSMRQAIEEGFIVDVLQGYVTYQRFFELAKAVVDDPEVDARKAGRALARFVDLHSANIEQKTAIIVEHFREQVAPLLEGRAKAMVVCDGRLMAVRYKQAFEAYIAEKGYGIGCLVAFSGSVSDPSAPTLSYTEVGLNGGVSEGALPETFASKAFRVLIVANKYQTGFDERRLCAMYVDKPLGGIQAVQTLSRLNRRFPGKRTTVLDFVNRREDILAAFQKYYETTTLVEPADPQQLHGLAGELRALRLFTEDEVEGFAGVFFGPADETTHARLYGWLKPAVQRFEALVEDEATPGEGATTQALFRDRLGAFVRLYGFLAQVVPFPSHRLEMLYVYGAKLARELPRPPGSGPLDLGDEVLLPRLRVQKMAEGALALVKGQGGELTGPTGTGTGRAEPKTEKLSTIIEVLNAKFSTDWDVQDLVDRVQAQLLNDDALARMVRDNDRDQTRARVVERLRAALVQRVAEYDTFVRAYFADAEMAETFDEWMLDLLYTAFRGRGGGE